MGFLLKVRSTRVVDAGRRGNKRGEPVAGYLRKAWKVKTQSATGIGCSHPRPPRMGLDHDLVSLCWRHAVPRVRQKSNNSCH